MIGHLKGTLLHQDLKSVILDVHGVGYKIYTNAHFFPPKQNNKETEAEATTATATTELWTYLAVRENALDLYGFATKEELEFFELLITVSGIGPKSAMAILSVASLPHLRQAIATGNTTHLVKVSGVGKKSAEKIVLELKDKFEGEEGYVSDDMDALEALKSLGYGERESREALKRSEGDTTEKKVRFALKNLNK